MRRAGEKSIKRGKYTFRKRWRLLIKRMGEKGYLPKEGSAL